MDLICLLYGYVYFELGLPGSCCYLEFQQYPITYVYIFLCLWVYYVTMCTVGAIHSVPLKDNIYAKISSKPPATSVDILDLCLNIS